MGAEHPIDSTILAVCESEAARMLGLSVKSLYRQRIAGQISFLRPTGGKILYAVSDLRKWIENNRRVCEPKMMTAAG